MNNNGKKLVIKEEDNIIEYNEKKNETQEKMNFKEKKLHNRLTLYQKLLSSEEFKKPITSSKVLDEDEYLQNLEKIIQRDYFPSLFQNQTVN